MTQSHRSTNKGLTSALYIAASLLLAFTCPWFQNNAWGATPWHSHDGFYNATNVNVPFTWINANMGGTRISVGDDAVSNQVTIPFNFFYYGAQYNSLYVSSNGWISFSARQDSYSNTYIPNRNAVPNNVICPFWDDLNPSGATGPQQGIWYKTEGVSPNRAFVIQWNEIPFYSTNERVTFEVVLYESSNMIKFQYLVVAATNRATGGAATVGMEDLFATNGIQYSFNRPNMIENSYALLFSPRSGSPTATPSVSPTNTPIIPSATPTATFTPAPTPIPGAVNVDITNIDSSGFPDISLTVRVTDLTTGNPVPNLGPSDFTLTEQVPLTLPVTQTISAVDPIGVNTGLSIAICLDISGSMGTTTMEQAKKATINFINNLYCLDEMALITFESDVDVVVPFTKEINDLEQAVKPLSSTGGTALYDAIYEAVQLTTMRRGTKAIIAFTDGDDTSSSRTLQQAILSASSANIPVYTIGIGSGANPQALLDMANQTGGDYYSAPTASQLTSIYQQISQNLTQQYLVTYTSSNPIANGGNRDVCLYYTIVYDCESYQANPSCIIDKNIINGGQQVDCKIDQVLAQQFRNNTMGYVDLDGVEVFFNQYSTSIVQMRIFENDVGQNKPGNLLASAQPQNVDCQGWFFFDFTSANLRLAPTSGGAVQYWFTLTWISGDTSMVELGMPGTAPGDSLIGIVPFPGQPPAWQANDPVNDLYFKVIACSSAISPTPTGSPSGTPTYYSPTDTPTLTPTLTVTPTPSMTPTFTPTLTPTLTLTPTMTKTNTPTLTATPTLTPTMTPTVDLTPPVILAAGYGTQTRLDTTNGGTLEMMAWIDGIQPSDIKQVEMYFNGRPTGVMLNHMATAPDSTELWGLNLPIGPGVPPGLYLFELAASDYRDNVGDLWPYLHIKNLPPPAPGYDYSREIQRTIEGHGFSDDALNLPADFMTDNFTANLRALPDAPIIPLAGYYRTFVSTQTGGELHMIAVVMDSNGDLGETEVYFNQGALASGLMLNDLDGFTAGDQVYGVKMNIDPGVGAGEYLLELISSDIMGNRSDVWPYLNVPSPTPTPSPTMTPTLTPTGTPTTTNTPTVTPTASPTPSPYCCFEIWPDPPVQNAGETVYVDATCSDYVYGGTLLYKWDWGDGQSTQFSTSPTASHIYQRSRQRPFQLCLTMRAVINGAECMLCKDMLITP